MNVVQDRPDGLVLAHVELCDRFDSFHPARRIRRDFCSLLVILVDAGDGFGQRALQCRVAREVLVDAGADAVELALDDALFRLAAGREQHLAVARAQTLLASGHGLHGEFQHLAQRLEHGRNDGVRGSAREIQHRDREHDQEHGRDSGIRSDGEQVV